MKTRLLSGFIITLLLISSEVGAQTSKILDKMGIDVSESEDRSISFTNKEAAFYYMQSHVTNHAEYAWFEGMNISKNRIFQGYNLYANGTLLSNNGAKVIVYPYKMVRRHHNALTEEFWMFDNKNILEVSLSGKAKSIGIELKGANILLLKQSPSIAYFKSMADGYIIGVSTKNLTDIRVNGVTVTSGTQAGGFFVAVGKNMQEVSSLIGETRAGDLALKKERIKRLETLLTRNVFTSSNSNPNLAIALNWLETTTDQLVTRQQGDGIYAGLPWFNEYWGRDEFISFPGAMLVTGQFKTARKILLSFAEYQNTDSGSTFFGRVPNIVNPQNIDYHTTDGTPRFIIALQDYVQYSGDTSIIRELYTKIKNSIEGPLRYHTDTHGYLLHADNETWMDGRDKNLVSYSPRGSRANDIQELWYKQLLAGVYFADNMKDGANASKWKLVAENVKANFAADFTSPNYSFLADRLTKEGKPEFRLRPNQLFALDMIGDPKTKNQTIDKVWRELVYPWGVATLNKQDSLFHPFHRTKDYPKDAAYHNGTIWPWLDGIAMQRMIEAEQPEIAYGLFKNMNWLALHKGVVGGLGENLDAFPHKGQQWPTLTGAYLQAWSNAEQLRTWYQYFLGVRPDMAIKQLVLAPRIPTEIKDLSYNFFIGNQLYQATYTYKNKNKVFSYKLGNTPLTVVIDVFPYVKKVITTLPNGLLTLTDDGTNLHITLADKKGQAIKRTTIPKSKERIEYITQYFQDLRNIPFASPDALKNHKVIKDVSQ